MNRISMVEPLHFETLRLSEREWRLVRFALLRAVELL
jgi:hypothetical protein